VPDLNADAGCSDFHVMVVVVVVPIAMLDDNMIAVAVMIPIDAARAANAVGAFLGANAIRERRRREGSCGCQHRNAGRDGKNRCSHFCPPKGFTTSITAK